MLFSSITFLVFFLPSVLVLYFMLPSRAYRNAVLFFSSLIFYAWGEPKYVFLMLASVIFNYNVGLHLGIAECETVAIHRRKLILTFAILVNIGLLFVFKYFGFSITILDIFLVRLHLTPLKIINYALPIGISFYTFQEISYLVDVYKNPENSQKSLLNLGLYISFFPQLIAGPIVRYSDVNAQIAERKETLSDFATGLERFIIGLSKKILIANSMAVVADRIYGTDIFGYGTRLAWIAAFSYALQIYYDFSGYSDMAIGLARMFGFRLPENFNYPYATSSITDFWRRWHISLTSFFRDYVYIPLGGNRKGKSKTVLNRFIVFFTTGLWHGASVNFVLWGLAHGSLMSAERVLIKSKSENSKSKELLLLTILKNVIHRSFTLLSVLLLWVLFRNGTKQTIKLYLKMLGINYTSFFGSSREIVQFETLLLLLDTKFYIVAIMGVLFSFPWWRKIAFLQSKSLVILVMKYLVLGVLFVLCYANLADNSYNPFIYFRF